MSLSLTPGTSLDFLRPFTSVLERKLDITNPNCQPVVFKVKTNAAKRYCARPNVGRIDPGANVSVSILLNPLKTQPIPGVECDDKFLVISAIIAPEDGNRDAAEILNLASAVKGRLHREKLKVVFLPSVGDGSLAENSVATAERLQEEAAHTLATANPHPSGPDPESTPIPTFPVPIISGPSFPLLTYPVPTFPIPVFEPSPSPPEHCDSDGFVVIEHEKQSDDDETRSWCSVSGISSSLSSAVDLSTAPANSESGHDLATELASAKAEIQRLRGLLRVRGAQSSPTTN